MRLHTPSLLLGLLACVLEIHAQDNHYESVHLGSRNSILSGASMSRWVDQTAVVNNPATMILSGGAGLTLSTAAATFENISFKNGLGNAVDIKSSSFILYPGFIAGELPVLKKEGDRTLGFAIYSHVIDKIRFTKRVAFTDNLIYDTDSPGDEAYVGIYSLDSDLGESVVALGWSERLSEQWSIGLTCQIFYRHQKSKESFSSTAIADQENLPKVDVLSVGSDFSLSYNIFFLRLKGGVAWRSGPWNAGLVLTIPSIRVWSGGDMYADLHMNNIFLGGERRSFYANTYVDGLKAQFKYPLQIGAGVSRKFRNLHTSLSVTWYGQLDRYTIADPGNVAFLQPPSDDNILYTPEFLRVWSENKSLVNIAASGIWTLSPVVDLLVGFRTDRHYTDQDLKSGGMQLSRKNWDRYHINSGIELSTRRSHWIIGLQYSTGKSENYEQLHSFDGVSEENYLLGIRQSGTIKQKALSLSLSYSFQLTPDSQE